MHTYTCVHTDSQDTYGLEKLYHEEMCKAYAADFPIETRMARYHNVYGPRGTWKVRHGCNIDIVALRILQAFWNFIYNIFSFFLLGGTTSACLLRVRANV